MRKKRCTITLFLLIIQTASTDTEVEKSCNRRHYPMYLPFQSDVIVNSKHVTNRVYLKAISSGQYYSVLLKNIIFSTENFNLCSFLFVTYMFSVS